MKIGVLSEQDELIGIINTEAYNDGDEVLHDMIKMLNEHTVLQLQAHTELSKQTNYTPMDEVFYMNYAEGQNSPTFKFTNLEDAMAEAARVSTNIKMPVYTLKAIKRTKPRHDVIIDELKELALPPANDPGLEGRD